MLAVPQLDIPASEPKLLSRLLELVGLRYIGWVVDLHELLRAFLDGEELLQKLLSQIHGAFLWKTQFVQGL
jgi:hypothetical protein